MKRLTTALFILLLAYSPFVLAEDVCEERMIGTYYAVPYSEPSGIHLLAIELLSDDPMNGKPSAYVEKQGNELVHRGAVSGRVFDISGYNFSEDKNLFNSIAGNGTTECGYRISDANKIKVFYADLKKANRAKVKELYDYFMKNWTLVGRDANESRFITKVSPRKMTLKAFTNTTYFLYQEYSDGIVGVALLVPLEKKGLDQP